MASIVLGIMGESLSSALLTVAHFRIAGLSRLTPEEAEGMLSVFGNLLAASSAGTVIFGVMLLSGLLSAFKIRRLRILALDIAILAVVISGFFFTSTSFGAGAQSGKAVVTMYNQIVTGKIEPNRILVILGVNGTVTWLNHSSSIHPETIGEVTGLFRSPVIEPGGTWSFTFSRAGEFQYRSLLHPWMTGTVVVAAR